MNARELITNAINVKAPWSVANESVDTGKYPNEVKINVIADARQTYHCPHCEKKRRVRDMVSIVWRHQNFFELPCFIVAQVPVIDCPSHGMVKVDIPWIRPASQLTVAQLAKLRQPSTARRRLRQILQAGEIGMGGDTCTRERTENN